MPYNPTPTIYLPIGLTPSNDFTASQDEKLKWTGSETFTTRRLDVTSYLPKIGSPCQYQGFTFMKVSKVTLKNISGGLMEVEVEFGGFQDGDDGDFEFDSDDGDLSKYTYQLGITTSTAQTEQNYAYKDVSATELHIIQGYKKGRLEPFVDHPYHFIPPADQLASPVNEERVVEITSELGKELIDKILKGTDTYNQANQIWRVTYSSKQGPSSSILNMVGKISTAKGAPPVSENRNWLFQGCDANSSPEGVWTITLEFELSDRGGWDPDLYS